MAEAIFRNATLSIAKATDSFNPDDTVALGQSDYLKRMLRFSAVAGDNRHNLALEYIMNKDESQRTVKTFSRGSRMKTEILLKDSLWMLSGLTETSRKLSNR